MKWLKFLPLLVQLRKAKSLTAIVVILITFPICLLLSAIWTKVMFILSILGIGLLIVLGIALLVYLYRVMSKPKY